MIIKNFENEEEWLEFRKGKITGSKKIKPSRGNNKLIGFYKLIADKLALPIGEDNPMERGKELEAEAIEEFAKIIGEKVDNNLVIWLRDDNANIALSPDGIISDEEAVEVKCLLSARHIEAFLKQEIPSKYKEQVLQYFVVNEKLQKLYFVFYNPKFMVHQLFYITILRETIKTEVESYLEFQRKTLEEVNEIVNKLSF